MNGAIAGNTISGTVYEDVDGDGSLAGAVGAAGVTVRLYRDNGTTAGEPDANDTLVASAVTDASGNYTLMAPANATYWVVVDSRTVSPAAGTAFQSRVWAEQTYAYANNVAIGSAGAIRAVSYNGSYQLTSTAGAFFGGLIADRSDDGMTLNAASAVGAEHIQRVTVASANVAGVDSGFSFNAIVTNRGDATDDDTLASRIQQGSLRQFIRNANATVGTQAADFSIGAAGSSASIALASQLDAIVDTVVLDAWTQGAPGYSGIPLIELNGASAGAGASGLTLAAGSSGSTIKGFASNRFNFFGILIDGSSNNVIVGNFLGTNAAGTAALGNNTGIRLGTNAPNSTTNNTIGGTTAAERNIISGNTVDGVQFKGAGVQNNIVQGNYIGLDVTGTADLGNASQGVAILLGASNNTIGGTAAGARNVISGNNGEGVRLIDAGTSGNVVVGNLIGTNAAGTAGIGNSAQGVAILSGAASNTIGGTTAGAGNTIAYNTLDGVAVTSTTSSGNGILGNAIFSNTGLGIDLSDDGVTANDGAKLALQPNLLMDFPVIQSAALSSTTLSVSGYIGSAPNDTDFAGARVEFFESSDGAGVNGEGQRYLGFLTADVNGNFSGTLTVSGLAVGERITATATDGSNNTSEFGLNVTVANGPPVAADDGYSVNEDNTLTIPAAPDWWNASWSQRKQLSFDNSGQAENLADFAVLVKLDNTRINYALTQNAGQDLRFVDADGTLLAHEIESWNESGTSYVWVKVPQINASSGADYIWMYYGNASALDGQNAEAVWDAGFGGVWHLHNDELDSAGTNEGSNSGSTNNTGIVGDGQSFDGVNDQVYTSTQFVNPQQYTLEAWFRTTSASGAKILGFENLQTGTSSGNWDRHLYVGTDGRLYMGSYDPNLNSEDVANSTATYTDGAWHYAVGVRNDATDTLLLYVDGVLVDSSANAESELYNGYLRMGGYKTSAWPAGADGYFNGRIDEARVSTQVRSADWIRAQYLSVSDGFVNFGAAQGIGVLNNDTDGDALSAVLVSGPGQRCRLHAQRQRHLHLHPDRELRGHRHLHLPGKRRQRQLQPGHGDHHRQSCQRRPGHRQPQRRRARLQRGGGRRGDRPGRRRSDGERRRLGEL